MIKDINFSKKAVERINQLIAEKPSGTFFRIAVKGGGCSGFKYDFSFDYKIDQNDLKHQKDYDFIVINDNLETCFKKVEEIINSEKDKASK